MNAQNSDFEHADAIDDEAAIGGAPAAATQPRLHGDMLATSLLAFLRVSSAYGYHLVQQLSEADLPAFDSGTVYRTLRQLEKGGLVSSFWDTSESGPARRMYQLTAPGQIFLSTWIDALERHQAILRRAIEAVQTGTAASADTSAAPPASSTVEGAPSPDLPVEERKAARRKRSASNGSNRS